MHLGSPSEPPRPLALLLLQVKQVHKVGQNCPGFGRHLNGLFKQAVTAGKRVRAETSISSGAVSVSSAAAELAQLKLPTHDFNDAKVRAPWGVGGSRGRVWHDWKGRGRARRAGHAGQRHAAHWRSRLWVKHFCGRGRNRLRLVAPTDK